MQLEVLKGDVTRFPGKFQAIVNAANSVMLGGGGVDAAIHGAAGPELLEACSKFPIMDSPDIRCPQGHVRLTRGYCLCDWVLHTVGPVWGNQSESLSNFLLMECYMSCMDLVPVLGVTSIAFPCISTGIYGFPKGRAGDIAAYTIKHMDKGMPPGLTVSLVGYTDQDVRFLECSVEKAAAWNGDLFPWI